MEQLETRALKASHLLVAYMEASGKNDAQICRALGKSATWVKSAKQADGYAEALEGALAELRDRILSQGLDIAAKFDGEVENSFNTIVEVRDGREELGSTRLKAAIEILDRAPSAPRKRDATQAEKRPVIMLPVQQLEYMRAALTDCQEAEVVELLDESAAEVSGGQGRAFEVREVDDD